MDTLTECRALLVIKSRQPEGVHGEKNIWHIFPFSEQVDTLGFDPREDGAVPSRGVNVVKRYGVSNMDKYVNTNVGIYHIESVCNYCDTSGQKLYHVKCNICGFESNMRLYNAKQATICKHKDRFGNFINFTSRWKYKKLQSIFTNMKDRCFNTENKDYDWYGGKNISICKEWLENPIVFEEWALSNGYADGLTIDRIDSNKDYCPDNCQWIPMEENSRKAGKVNWITVGEETLTGKQWSDKLGIGTNIINTAIRNYGEDKTKELIQAMLQDSPSTKNREPTQSWFSVYGIQV